MYNSFLGWELGVKKMALFLNFNKWKCVSSIGVPKEIFNEDEIPPFNQFERMKTLEGQDDKVLKLFQIIIPVIHNGDPIAYVLLGEVDSKSQDGYNKIQFITAISNIVAVAIENKKLFKNKLERERMLREMELASEMQLMLVPDVLPSNDSMELASIYMPQIGIGGDYYDYIELKDGRMLFCVADISGKGIAAALLMSNFQSTLRYCVNKMDTIEDLIKELNFALFNTTQGNRFLTMFLGIYCPNDGRLEYVNAGHQPPIMVINKKTQILDKGCTILGNFKNLMGIEVGEINVFDGMLLVYTDGLTDLQNDRGDYLDEKLLHEFVNNRCELSATEFNLELLERISLFKGKTEYPDDFTVLTCKFKKAKSS